MSVKKRGELSNGLPDDPLSGGDYQPRPSHDPDPDPELDLDAADELKIIDAALGGDAEAFSNLFERYRPDLYGFCLRRLDDPSEAEDVVQEIFIRAVKNLSSFDRSKRIWPWLATIALRLCTDVHRERSRTHYSGDIGVTIDSGIGAKGHESLLDSVIASEGREQLMKSLKALPERQRRALELYALEGLSYEDIAAAEGISVGAVELLLVRARRKMREARRNGTLGLVAPFTWLRWRVQRIEEKIRPLLGVYGEGLSSICAQALCLGALTMVVVATSLPNKLFAGNDAVTSGEIVLSSTQSPPLKTSSLSTALPRTGASAEAPVESRQPILEAPGSLVVDLINPSETATPENTGISSIMVSPSYASDHTILMAGSRWGFGQVLFVSHDGGASWKSLPSRFLFGVANVAIPSGYPQDRRVFAIGSEFGLQQSDDGGEIFRTVLAGMSFAVSPSFGRGDSKVLVGGKILLEYDADTGVTKPASLPVPPSSGWAYTSITFSPSYSSDQTVLVSGDYSNGQTVLYRCGGVTCDETQFPFRGPLTLRLSPRFDRDGLAYAFTEKRLLISNDGARTFQEVQFPPLSDWGSISDVAMMWDASSDPAVFVSAAGNIYRSINAGRSWNKTTIDIPGWGYAYKVVTTPTGRLLATGGFACSTNQGQTWTPRCPPE